MRKLIAAVLATVATFVILFGAGMTSWAIVALGGALLALAVGLVAVGTVRTGARAWVTGFAQVHQVSEPPAGHAFGRCELQIVIDAPGLPARSVKVIDPRVPVAKWPTPGQMLPIRVAIDDQRHVRILWDEMPTHAEAAAQPDLAPDFGFSGRDDFSGHDDDLLIGQEPPPWLRRGPDDDPPLGDPDTADLTEDLGRLRGDPVVVRHGPGGALVLEGTLVEQPLAPLPRRPRPSPYPEATGSTAPAEDVATAGGTAGTAGAAPGRPGAGGTTSASPDADPDASVDADPREAPDADLTEADLFDAGLIDAAAAPEVATDPTADEFATDDAGPDSDGAGPGTTDDAGPGTTGDALSASEGADNRAATGRYGGPTVPRPTPPADDVDFDFDLPIDDPEPPRAVFRPTDPDPAPDSTRTEPATGAAASPASTADAGVVADAGVAADAAGTGAPAAAGDGAGEPGAISGVGVTLLVTDLGRSVAFYRDKLGFHEIDRGDGNAVLASGGTRLVIRAIPEVAPVNRRLVHLNLDVGDVEATYRDLRDKGVRFTYAPRIVNRGRRTEVVAAAFRDPDGHGIALTQWRERPTDPDPEDPA